MDFLFLKLIYSPAASPDGIIGNDKLVEVKKVHPKNNEDLLEALIRRRICKKNGKGQLILNPTHSYYYQVQQFFVQEEKLTTLWPQMVIPRTLTLLNMMKLSGKRT